MHTVFVTRQTSVKTAVVIADVTKAVPLRRGLRVPIVQHVVRPQGSFWSADLMSKRLPAEERRAGEFHLPVQCKHRAARHELGRFNDAFGCLQIETAEVVGRRPDIPGARMAVTKGKVGEAR